MLKKGLIAILFLTLTVASATAAEPAKSTLDDQTKLEVTVYNNNLGLVKDIRKLKLPTGEGELRFMDVASQIMPQTVHISSINQPEGLSILEQNYEYDLINANKLLDKFVGEKITLLDRNEYQGTEKTVEATILSNNGGPIYQIGNQIYLEHPGYRILPRIPENLIAKPTLTWMYANKSAAPHDVKVSYLTNGINWLADYILVVDKSDTTASLNGWVTVNNNSGATYQNAKLKLVAGEVNRVQPMFGFAGKDSRLVLADAIEAEGFAEAAFFEYHIYDLQRTTTIKDKQTKQISLLSAEGVKVKKELLARGEAGYYRGQYTHGEPMKMPIQVNMKFKNSEENKLGMPLPAGTVRLYKEDNTGSLQFAGEDRIDHTPKDEEVSLKIGEAFDVVGERRQTDYQRLGSTLTETAWEISLRNHKEEPVTVVLLEPVGGDWQVIQNSHPFSKADAFTMRYEINVPKDGEVKVTYRVRVRD